MEAFVSLMKNDLPLRDIFYEEGQDFFRKLKALDVDVYLNDAKDVDIMTARALDKPSMTQHFYVPVCIAEWNMNYPT